jgi:hypothetical protein
MPVASGSLDPQCSARGDERSLECPDERPDEQATFVETNDRIRDELARTVVGDLAATLDPLDGDPASGELIRGDTDVGGIGVFAEGQDRRMLEQEELVTDPAVGTLVEESLLECVGLAVIDPAKPRRLHGGDLGVARAEIGIGIDEDGLHVRTIAGVPRQPFARVTQWYRCAVADRVAAQIVMNL